MYAVEEEVVVVNKETTRLEGFRLEDTAKAPAVIVFVDDDEPQLVPFDLHGPVPLRVKSKNNEAEIQVIGNEEIKKVLGAR